MFSYCWNDFSDFVFQFENCVTWATTYVLGWNQWGLKVLMSKIVKHDFEPTFKEKNTFIDNEGCKRVSLWEWIVFDDPYPLEGPSFSIYRVN